MSDPSLWVRPDATCRMYDLENASVYDTAQAIGALKGLLEQIENRMVSFKAKYALAARGG